MEEPTRTRKTSQLVSIDATGAEALIHTLSAGRTARIKKIMLMNNTGVHDLVTFGDLVTGAAWTARMPDIYILTPFDEQLNEWEIPQYEFQGDIYARSAQAGVGTTEDVMIEVEEIG